MKTRYILFITLAALIGSSRVTAQQLPYFNHFFLNPNMMNPSLSGLNGETDLMVIQKNSLIGLPESPKTLFLNFTSPLSDKAGLGASIYRESLGVTSKTMLYGSYAYRIQFQKDHNLNFGLSLGVVQFSFDPDMTTLNDPNDPVLLNKSFKSAAFDGNFGITYINRNFQFGIAMLQGFAGEMNFASDVNYTLEPNFVSSIQYRLFLNQAKSFSVTPIVVARYAKSTLPQDVLLSFNWRDKLWLVPAYNSSGAVSVTAAAQVYDQFKIGYGFETIQKSPVNAMQKGGHEIMLSYRFNNNNRRFKQQQDEISKLSEKMGNIAKQQAVRDSLQDANIKKGDDSNKDAIEQNQAEIKKTREALDALRRELIEAGVIREFEAAEYDNAQKGYYIVIASVKNTRYNQKAMDDEYLSKGYKKVYNKVRGWHYVYTVRVDDFSESLQLLKETRATIQKNAWIHILK